MIIHAHLIVWNEEVILPHTLKHYLGFCDRVFIWDNGSTDRTLDIIAKYNKDNKIIYHKFDTSGTFDDITNIQVKNGCWKLSRETSDYVIVADCDELVYHEDIKGFLAANSDYTFFVPQWFEMIGDKLPAEEDNLLAMTKFGYMNAHSKMLLFNPNKVKNVNWSVGAHEYRPDCSEARACYDQSLKTLHYKYLSVDYVIERYKVTSARFSAANRRAGFGRHHFASETEIRQQYELLKSKSEKVLK